MRKVIVFCALVFFAFSPLRIAAQESDPKYQEKLKEIDQLKGKISQLQGEARTLSSAISYLTNKKTLTQKQIETTEFEITLLTREIASLDGKIETLEVSLDEHVGALIADVQQGYKQIELDPYQVFLSSRSFGDVATRVKYLQLAQAHHSQVLQKTGETKVAYDTQKEEKETAHKKMEGLQKKLIGQQKDLQAQEEAKKKILADTKNSEGNYQKLLAQAEAELSSMRAFTSSKTGGMLPPQNSPDGWYFSQRDERWGGRAIGNSALTSRPDTIYDVGCLVSSVAMIKKKYGEDVTPASIAASPGYFYLNTGSMRRPWPAPGGYRYENIDRRDLGLIDGELKDGRPVIVKLSVRTNTVGTHFIVIKSGSNGDYTIHDPWEGYDKKFSQFYSTGQIISIGILKKN